MPSVKSIALKITFCVLAGAFALTGYSQLNGTESSRGELYKKISHTRKLKTPLTVRINNIEDSEVSAGKVFDLEADIKSAQDFKDLAWEWSAPSEVELLDRNDGQNLNVSSVETVKLKMRFRQNGNQNHEIRLVLKDSVTGNIVGRGRFNTTKQREMASETEAIMKRQEEYLGENSDALVKTKELKHTH